MNIVFESPKVWHKYLIKVYLRFGSTVWVIEPFYTYHHEKGIRFFPRAFPKYIEELIRNNKVNLLKVKELDVRETYSIAANKAVETIERAYLEYKKRHFHLIKYLSDTLDSPVSENIFKKQLCDRLAVFYSVNIMLDKIEKMFSRNKIKIYVETNVITYSYLKKLLEQSNQQIYYHKSIIFASSCYLASIYGRMKDNFMIMLKLFAQIALNCLSMYKKNRFSSTQMKSYKYGVTIISPTRQLVGKKGGPDFIVDNKKVHNRDMVYFPLCTLNREQKNRLGEFKSDIFYPFCKYDTFSHILEWMQFFWIFFKYECFKNVSFTNEAYASLVEYFRWKKIMTKLKIKHFVTHCDFGIYHIARNIALNQSGVQTWYFSDTLNFTINFAQSADDNNNYHPFWTYLYYDHFVTWTQLIADFFNSHPGNTFKEYHVVGCLLPGYISNHNLVDKKKNSDKFIIVAYDSTYTRNSFTSHEEGIVFAQHILKLADDCPWIEVIFKEKKKRSTLVERDSMLGPKLLALYDLMNTRNNIKVYREKKDASNFISISDMIISFPFTSTTFEALSINKPAIWHDPMGYYRGTSYGKTKGVVTHSYDELKTRLLEINNMKPGTYKNPIPINSPLMDPYRDGKALERFRVLLAKS